MIGDQVHKLWSITLSSWTSMDELNSFNWIQEILDELLSQVRYLGALRRTNEAWLEFLKISNHPIIQSLIVEILGNWSLERLKDSLVFGHLEMVGLSFDHRAIGPGMGYAMAMQNKVLGQGSPGDRELAAIRSVEFSSQFDQLSRFHQLWSVSLPTTVTSFSGMVARSQSFLTLMLF